MPLLSIDFHMSYYAIVCYGLNRDEKSTKWNKILFDVAVYVFKSNQEKAYNLDSLPLGAIH